MSSSTKIVVLRSKELIYSIVLLIVSILIILAAVSIFAPSDSGTKTSPTQTPQSPQAPTDSQTPDTEPIQQGMLSETQEAYDTSALYVPGIYTSVLQLGSSAVEMQLTVDKDHINSITFTNIDDAVATMYPLMQPTLSELSAVIIEEQSLDNVTYAEENRYTSMLLLNTISDLLERARASENADSPAQLTDSLNMQ